MGFLIVDIDSYSETYGCKGTLDWISSLSILGRTKNSCNWVIFVFKVQTSRVTALKACW